MEHHQEDLLKLGRRIADLRNKAQKTQLELSIEIDMDRPHLSQIENGLKDVKFSTLLDIAKGLGITLSELVDYDH